MFFFYLPLSLSCSLPLSLSLSLSLSLFFFIFNPLSGSLGARGGYVDPVRSARRQAAPRAFRFLFFCLLLLLLFSFSLFFPLFPTFPLFLLVLSVLSLRNPSLNCGSCNLRAASAFSEMSEGVAAAFYLSPLRLPEDSRSFSQGPTVTVDESLLSL